MDNTRSYSLLLHITLVYIVYYFNNKKRAHTLYTSLYSRSILLLSLDLLIIITLVCIFPLITPLLVFIIIIYLSIQIQYYPLACHAHQHN